MSNNTDTTRRTFLKAGALVAAPAAAIGIPVAAIAADDGSKAALARLQDERAIEALNRDFLRAFNRGGAKSTANLFADRAAPGIAKHVRRLSLELADAPRSFVIADDGASATARYDCTVEIAQELEGDETLVQMARLQGNAAGVESARKTLSARYAKGADGWMITEIELA